MSALRNVLIGIALGAAALVGIASPASAGVVRGFDGTVFDDVDGDGTQDPGDLGIAGCTVSLDTDADGSVDATDTTDADGLYSLVQNGPNAARISATCTARTDLTGPQDFASGNGSVTDVDFAFFNPAQIFGDVFEDLDADGVVDPGEGFIDGCTVTLDEGADGSVEETIQSLDGFFFGGLLPGTYRLGATCPGRTQTVAPADIVITETVDLAVLFGFGAQVAPTTTAVTPIDLVPLPTTTTRVLARTGPSDADGGLGLIGFGLLVAGGGFITLAARRRAAA
jgi:hypothetical protein